MKERDRYSTGEMGRVLREGWRRVDAKGRVSITGDYFSTWNERSRSKLMERAGKMVFLRCCDAYGLEYTVADDVGINWFALVKYDKNFN